MALMQIGEPARRAPVQGFALFALGFRPFYLLAAAYAALANDGWLPGLTLIREIRDPGGTVVYHHTPTPVRRVLTSEVAARVREFLREAAAEAGTGSRAQLASYRVLGKTGTARNVVGRSYAPGHYTASFAGIFS